MSLPDSFYLALCMTVLLVGAVYWVWTQMQFVQRKVNVLENIVYELKTLCSKQAPDPHPLPPVSYPPAPSSVLGEDEDLLHETLQKEVDDGIAFETLETSESVPEPAHQPATLEDILQEETVFETEETIAPFNEPEKSDDLQPGGIGSGVSDQALSSALDGMQVKELRRLAEQRGITGVKEKKRKELIEAIRAAPVPAFFG
jgi:hypothetical protein